MGLSFGSGASARQTLSAKRDRVVWARCAAETGPVEMNSMERIRSPLIQRQPRRPSGSGRAGLKVSVFFPYGPACFYLSA
jgi:hypothetical protein